MRNIYLAASAAILIAACSENGGQPQTESPASGVILENFDTSVRPQDDFYRYVNGAYLDHLEIPADKSRYSVFNELADRNEAYLKVIVDDVVAADTETGSEAQKVADLYKSFTDTARINELGVAPIGDELAYIAKLSSREDLIDAFAHFAAQRGGGFGNGPGVVIPFSFSVGQDAKEASRYRGFLSQSGLGLPDREFYFLEDEKSRQLLAQYQDYIAKLFELAGLDDAGAKAATVIAMEKALAQHHWIRTENRDRDKTYNKVTLDELQALTPHFDWSRYFTAIGTAAQDTVIIRQPSYLEGFNQVFADAPINEWKTYLTFKLLHGYAPELSEDFVNANFDFFGRAMQGTPEIQPRWKRGLARINADIGHSLGKLYVARHFTPEAKQRMSELVENLRAAFSDRLDTLEWMSAETREQARDKLNKFRPQIGYPDKWRDYSSIEIKADDLIGNVKRAHAYAFRFNMDQLGKPVDREDWFINPQLVNAFYSSTRNAIVFPAGILQPPFFDIEADDAVNYGAIGGVIGHEMGHGFDDQGSKSDGEGNLRNWWTEADKAEFVKRTDALVAQYNQFSPLENLHINGRLTLGENIGDLGGLSIAYRAYKLSLDGQGGPEVDGYTAEQRFFIGWAQIWRNKMREAAARRQLILDSHSRGEFRANGVMMNMPAFYEAFDVKEGDGLYRPPEDRISIW